MKKISTQRNVTRSKLLRTAFIASLVLVLAGGSLYALEKTRVTNIVKDPFYVSEEQKNEQATKDDPTTKNKGNNTSVEGVDTNKTTNEVPESKSIAISIKSINQSSGSVTAKISINSPQKGVCSFTFSKDRARPVVRSIETSTDSCEVSIPEQEFEMIGTWSLSAHFFSNDTQASATGSVSIQ